MSDAAAESAAQVTPVRMGELVVSKARDEVLTVVGLGSCVAVVLIAPEKGAAGLAHVVLPELRMTGGREAPAGKFADTAVPAMLEELRKRNVKPGDLYGVLVGGATMFGHKPGSKLAGVGDRNAEAAREQLAKHGIGIASEDIGGTNGRSVQVFVGDGKVVAKSGIEPPVELPGSEKPMTVKVPQAPSDAEPEPFPDDIWHANAAQG
ncbi:MAG: chemotaxis protein CheD [Solirubrobacterales bacterium]